MADIFTILYVLVMIVALMFAVGFCLGIACIVVDKVWQFIDQVMMCKIRN